MDAPAFSSSDGGSDDGRGGKGGGEGGGDGGGDDSSDEDGGVGSVGRAGGIIRDRFVRTGLMSVLRSLSSMR